MTDNYNIPKCEDIVKDCKDCYLSKYRKNIVVGDGDPTNPIYVIGEAPGADEDLQGLPFIGKSGQLLRSGLNSFIDNQYLFYSNIVMCRPPKNQISQEYIDVCYKNIYNIICKYMPDYIITVGKTSYTTITGSLVKEIKDKYMKPVNVAFNNKIIKVLPIVHPAAILRNTKLFGGPKDQYWKDTIEFLANEIQDS